MGYVYYALVLLYPFISLILNWLLGNVTDMLTAAKNEFYLWLGVTFAFLGAFFLLLSGVRWQPSPLLYFVIYTIVYFSVSILRKMVYSDTHSLWSAPKST